MKRCPTCKRTYADDAPPFCADDGAQLIKEEAAPHVPPPTVAQAGPPSPPRVKTSSGFEPGVPAPSYAPAPRRSKGFAIASMILGCVSFTLMLYLAWQVALRNYFFSSRILSRIILSAYGFEFGLGFVLMIIAVLLGAMALFQSIRNPTRYGGKILAIMGPFLCVLMTLIAVGTFVFRQIEGPPSYYSNYPTYPSSRPSPTPATSSTTSMTDEEKYRLFYAATKTDDKFLQSEAAKKIGIIDAADKPTAFYQKFVAGSVTWAMNDTSFIKSVDTPEKARAYVNSHMNY